MVSTQPRPAFSIKISVGMPNSAAARRSISRACSRVRGEAFMSRKSRLKPGLQLLGECAARCYNRNRCVTAKIRVPLALPVPEPERGDNAVSFAEAQALAEPVAPEFTEIPVGGRYAAVCICLRSVW